LGTIVVEDLELEDSWEYMVAFPLASLGYLEESSLGISLVAYFALPYMVEEWKQLEELDKIEEQPFVEELGLEELVVVVVSLEYFQLE